MCVLQFGKTLPASIRMTEPGTLDVKGKLTVNGENLETLMHDVIDKKFSGRSNAGLTAKVCYRSVFAKAELIYYSQERQSIIARKQMNVRT